MDNFEVIVRYWRSFTEKKLKEFDLTFGEQIIIIFLSKNENVNQESISKRYMIDKGMVAKTLTRLEDKGFIKREQNPNNKRENIISLTEKSAYIMKYINAIFDDWNKILYGEMSKEDIDCVKRLTGKMAENVAKYLD
ncbi:MAG: MarR family winged helix-turn-helix transcriptional regulator [Clostridium sp.]|uniref:MarR family winged helix-turn-helix transcriptional regulator n=1 Tax=Clostridium sp. TaxID=1506 RepID=UPI002A90FA10|nr:MarR family winged helix-turn-helix transcriptional regulator [Clostridium sp.]MDY6226378.1 MarR family winged helix-turn-helix transcriptional regulator [Clostridium sp.]